MHSHERIDPRRGPGRERDDGKREIHAGVAEYEEDRDAERERQEIEDDSAYDLDFDLEDVMAERDEQRGGIPTPEPDDAISARAENNRIVIEAPIPANTTADDWAKIVEDLTRRIAIGLTTPVPAQKLRQPKAAPGRPPCRGDLP